MKQAIEAALSLVEEIEEAEEKLSAINRQLRAIYGDFYPHLPIATDAIACKSVDLADAVLGEELASYYLFVKPAKGGVIIGVDGTEWPMQSIDQLQSYVYHMHGLDKEEKESV